MEGFNVNSHYFVPLQPQYNFGFVSFTSSSDEPHMIECILKPYEFSGFAYKLYVMLADSNLWGLYGKECFYSSDFYSMIKSGQIIEKTSNKMKVVPVHGAEHLYGSAYLIHEGETIIEEE